jgi:hypothetical protein
MCAGAQDVVDKEKSKIELKPNDYILPFGAKELTRESSFPASDDEARGIYLYQPGELRGSPRGLLYITDQRSSEILIFNLSGKHERTIGGHGQGPGDLMMPNQIAFHDDKVIVRDIGNRRMQFLDEQGAYQGGFKVFKDYWSFIAKGGNIYAIPIQYVFPTEYSDRSLIDVIDFQGRVISSFGSLIEVNPYDSVPLTSAKIVLGSNSELWVSFKWFPIVRKYSLKGSLLGEYHYSYGIVDKKESFNRKMMAQRTRASQVSYSPVCSALCAAAKGLYLLGSSPGRLDILLMDHEGRISEFYWFALEEYYWCSGLYVLEEKDGAVFYVLDHNLAHVDVLKVKKGGEI